CFFSLLVLCLIRPLASIFHTCDSLFPVPVKTKGKYGVPERETEKRLSGVILPVPKQKLAAAEEKLPGQSGIKAWMETEDILSHFRSPYQGPELDLDSLYHPMSEEIQDKEEPKFGAILYHQALQGPEEDLDHISHPM
uniref:Proline-rich acidic protein 1 n=1 Tax=Nannospalax galili TaxID=1026970 RepID=A0A8C6RZ34_NANGA